jgi:hypothetical protein
VSPFSHFSFSRASINFEICRAQFFCQMELAGWVNLECAVPETGTFYEVIANRYWRVKRGSSVELRVTPSAIDKGRFPLYTRVKDSRIQYAA